MEKLYEYLDILSTKGEARAIKVAIATIIAVFLSSVSKYIDAATISITVFLVFGLFFTVSGSRNYAMQRILSNVYALVISLIVGFLFKWNMYAIALVNFLIILMYFKFNLENKISLLSSGAASMIFYIGVNSTKVLDRFISMVIGFVIAILINEIVLPTNNGLIVENNIKDLMKSIFDIKEDIMKNGKIGKINCDKLLDKVQKINENVILLEKEIDSAPFRNHLRKYKDKVEIFKSLSKVSKMSYNLIRYLDEERAIFDNLGEKEKTYIMDVLNRLYINHKILAENVLHNNEDNIKLEKITYNNLKFESSFNIILMSKLLEYEESLIELSKTENL